MLASLKEQLGDARAQELNAIYTKTRTKLIENIFAEFKGAEPALSDHGATHIANVLDNVYHLFATTGLGYLTGVEWYLLGMCILFHDTGNLYGRKDHHKKISEIFDWVLGTDASVRRQKTLILSATRAHTGKAADGTYDTLKDLSQSDHLWNEKVRLQELSAVLRFADELAEGPQRTSEFMLEKNLYAGDSRLYHEYASVTHVWIDRGNERILLTYEIPVDPTASIEDWKNKLSTLLDFVYKRAVKLDQERRYARYYSEVLSPFKATWIKLNFHCHGEILDFPQSARIDDKVVPGDHAKSLQDADSAYRIDDLLAKIAAAMEKPR
jgi:hypothetical protein